MENRSLRLYIFLSDKLGTEGTVRTRRTYYITHNCLTKTKTHTPFFCGSRAEGLDMKGSDTDKVILLNDIHIVEKSNNDIGSNTFVMRTCDTRPGFAQLELCSSYEYTDVWCKKIGHKFFLSSSKMKQKLLSLNENNVVCTLNTLHGSCVSTVNETHDCTVGLKCKSFIKQAQDWVRRQRCWPSEALKKKIIDSGVWFVPIGYKLSPTEDIEWRVAFGVAEKLLVYSFTHTQLLVYVLLKIILKDVNEKNPKLKELLCSYFLKTVVFWVSEEIAVTEWTPHNFEKLFLECLKRLEYYVKQDILPHYFIKERNVLEQRITLPEWRNLKTTIVQLYKNYPVCLTSSSFMSAFFCCPQYENISQNILPGLNETGMADYSKCSDNLTKLNEVRFLLLCGQAILTNKLTPWQVLTNSFGLLKRNHDRFIFRCLFSTLCRNIGTRFTYQYVTRCGNKLHYQHLKEMLPFVLMGVRSDGISGWNVLATYYYCVSEYSVSLKITDYVLSKFKDGQQEKLYYSEDKFTVDNLANQTHDFFLNSIYITNTMEPNDFSRNSFLIPGEMKPEVEHKGYIQKPPIVYTLFLRFACLLKLEQTQKCLAALNEMKTFIESNNYIGNHVMKAECYTLLGIGCYLIGDLTEAGRCHRKALTLDRLKQMKYLKMINRIR
ncbi:uncharacterized protein LOC127704630 isoform X2 [Mytilus californianus]|uniref:uncharacterized protein LOC127704630 isoform X2 n=1 Tax=Mytilus californianus TaxID=6549 RepID=UPI0022470BBC|nr:uncharacterized protein LOC127704630 isoform X2 [Mytilus californianus]